MSASQQQDETQNISERDDKVSSIAEEKDVIKDNAEDLERRSCHSAGSKPEPGDSSILELQNVNAASECLDSGPKEPDSQIQSNCTSDNGNPPVQRFKNVVAIVDPPRGGLHPTVSNTQLLLDGFDIFQNP